MASGSLSKWVDRADAWQQRRRVPGFLVAIWVKYRDDRGQQYAALLSYYGFISLFPLLIAFAAVLSVVLRDDPTLRAKILDSLIGRLPVIGDQIRTDTRSLEVSGIVLVIGFVTLLWAGVKVVRHAQNALNEQWGVPYIRRPGIVRQSIRALALLAVIGVAVVGATALTSLAAFGDLPGLQRLAGVLFAVAVNVLLLGISFELLTERRLGPRTILPGAVAGGVGLWVLQVIGGTYVEWVVADASNIYGTFATVFGLLVWLALLARVVLLANEVNVVLHDRAWPKTFVRPTTLPAAPE